MITPQARQPTTTRQPTLSSADPLPNGFRVVLDAEAEEPVAGLWLGGSPARVLRLSAAGRVAWRELQTGPVGSSAAGALGRRFTDAGMAHPEPPHLATSADLTVVIPVRDRPSELSRCLSALDNRHPVLVVDDGSREPAVLAAVADRPGVTLLVRHTNGGPGAARNTALAHVDSELVAFLDSDCVPTVDWADRLAAHFADPTVGAVAPRIVGSAGGPCGLDLGERPGLVAPNARISYLPTAAMVVRRAALADIATTTAVFDQKLRVGEDVDLVWRLQRAGWRVRYDPHVHVGHQEPATRIALLARRFRYGTSAAPLALRHPRSVPPLVVSPWPALTVLALLARRPLPATVGFALAAWTTIRTLRRAGIPTGTALRVTMTAVHRTWLGIGRYSAQFAAPLLVLACLAPDRQPLRRWGRRAAVASLLLGSAHSGKSPTLTAIADDIAYGHGVLAGCLRHRTVIPVRPVIAIRTRK